MKRLLGLFLVLILLFVSVIFGADSNGIWHRAEDVRSGTFGSDEGGGWFVFTGRVGIGIDPPSRTLDVSNFNFNFGKNSGDHNSDGFMDSDSGRMYTSYGDVIGAPASRVLTIEEYDDPIFIRGRQTKNKNLSDSFVSFLNGNIGIGTINPERALHVTSKEDRIMLLERNGVGKKWAFNINANRFNVIQDTDGTIPLTIENDGDIGIGITTPSAKLHVDGDIKATTVYIGGKEAATKEYIDSKLSSSASIYFPSGRIAVTGNEDHNYNSWSTAWCPAGYKVLYGKMAFTGSTCDPPCGCGRNSKPDWVNLGQYPVKSGGLEGWRTGTYGHCNTATAYCAPK